MKNNKKIRYIIIFILTFIFLTLTQLLFFGSRLDYFWNYNNSLQISNGLLPYQDINMITTPLFHIIISLSLALIGKSIVVYASILSIIEIIHIYILLKILNLLLDKKGKQLNIVMYFIYIITIYSFYYEYNLLSCLFVALIIYIEICNKNSKKSSFLIGLCASLSLLAKQTIGIFTIIFILFKPFIFKDNLKSYYYRILGILIPIISFFTYLLFTNTLDNFISYCITGLKEFNNAVSLFEFMKINDNVFHFVIILLIYLVCIIVLFYYLFKLIKKNLSWEIKIYFYYVIICFICVYPIRDLHHILPGFISIFPLIYLIFYKKIKNKINKINFNYLKIIRTCFFVLIVSIPFITINMYIKVYINKEKDMVTLKSNYNTLNGIVVKTISKKNIDTIIEFEKKMHNNNLNTIILDDDAVVYHLSQNIYYKDYDLFMRGNFGKNGEKRLIKEISDSNNNIYLIDMYSFYNKDKKYNQIPDKVVEYVINNYDVIGNIEQYTIYYDKQN